jgi:hypothetical protein
MDRLICLEIVKTRAKKLYTPGATNYALSWHGVAKALNGKAVWTTEPMKTRAGVLNAIRFFLAVPFRFHVVADVDKTGDAKKGGKK